MAPSGEGAGPGRWSRRAQDTPRRCLLAMRTGKALTSHAPWAPPPVSAAKGRSACSPGPYARRRAALGSRREERNVPPRLLDAPRAQRVWVWGLGLAGLEETDGLGSLNGQKGSGCEQTPKLLPGLLLKGSPFPYRGRVQREEVPRPPARSRLQTGWGPRPHCWGPRPHCWGHAHSAGDHAHTAGLLAEVRRECPGAEAVTSWERR